MTGLGRREGFISAGIFLAGVSGTPPDAVSTVGPTEQTGYFATLQGSVYYKVWLWRGFSENHSDKAGLGLTLGNKARLSPKSRGSWGGSRSGFLAGRTCIHHQEVRQLFRRLLEVSQALRWVRGADRAQQAELSSSWELCLSPASKAHSAT